MALYAEFYETRNGTYVSGMGSDSTLSIDGRLRLKNAMACARAQAHSLRYVENYTAYRLYRGSIREPSFITDYIPLPPNHDYGKRVR